MNGGVTVVLCIVGALALCEAVLPRTLAILRRHRQEERAKKAIGTGEGAPLAENEAAVQCPPSPVREDDSGQRTEDRGQRRNMRRTTREAPAAKLEAQVPEPQALKDYEDLGSVYAAAKQGRPEAMVQLGEFAYSRGAIVEAFYWTILAEMKGAEGLDEMLFEMRTRWLAEGCPGEFENAYEEFDEEQGEFARTVLGLQCDIDPQYAYARLQELAGAGNGDAQLFVQGTGQEVES